MKDVHLTEIPITFLFLDTGCLKKGEPISCITTADHLICFYPKQQFYVNRNMPWVTMCMCSFPISFFPNQSFNVHLLVACCQQIIIIKIRKFSFVGVLKWDGFKYHFLKRKERKLPKKQRNVWAKRDENPHRTIPLPQQQGTKKVCEMGSGTWFRLWVGQNHFKIRNLQVHDGYIKGSLLVHF